MIENVLEIRSNKPMKLWVKYAILEMTPEEAEKVNSPLEMDKYYKEREEMFYYVATGEQIRIDEINIKTNDK